MPRVNPYEPPTILPKAKQGSHFAFIWNCGIFLGGIFFTSLLCIAIVLAWRWAYTGTSPFLVETQFFLKRILALLHPSLGLYLFLFSLSTYSFHIHRRAWQLVYSIVLVSLAYDFDLLAFTTSASTRAIVFAISYFPVLVCGYGWPSAIYQLQAYARARP